MAEDEWDRVLQVNLKSVFLGTRAALRRMIPRKRGVIVSVASGTGLRGASDGGAHYAASKAGIIGFTRSVAKEVKDTGIRINCVGPGATESDLWRVGKSAAEVQQLLASGRINRPSDFADVVVFLASDSSWPLTGEFIARET
jgi:NAD(P)-dependent dehydrogenase (short-subunit alcohol dehydrogenase family)